MTKLFNGLRVALTVADMVSHARYIYGLTTGFVAKYGPPLARLVLTVRVKLAKFIAPKNLIG